MGLLFGFEAGRMDWAISRIGNHHQQIVAMSHCSQQSHGRSVVKAAVLDSALQLGVGGGRTGRCSCCSEATVVAKQSAPSGKYKRCFT
jgi:hypothetical protein